MIITTIRHGFASYLLLFLCSPIAVVAAEEIEDSLEDVEQVVVPEIYRRDVKAPKIDARDFEVTAYVGILNMEDFGANAVGGLRLAYHITEDFFMEAGFAASEINDDSFRQFGLNVFPSSQESLTYYDLMVGYNVLPGEFFWGENYSIPSALYISAGAGSFTFVDEDFFSANFGFGVRALITQAISVHIDLRDRVIFDSSILGDDKITNNLEFTIGVGVFF